MGANKYKCHKQNYFNNRMWLPGMIFVGQKANKHFTLTSGTLQKGDTALDPKTVRKPGLKAGIGEAPGAKITTPGKANEPVITGQNPNEGMDISDEDIKGVLQGMDHKVNEQWTADGKPLMTYVESMLGVNVTRKRLEEVMPNFSRGITPMAQASDAPNNSFLG